MAKILAVVVTYNRLELLKDAIKSLRSQEKKCDILVVNNGSTDGSGEWLDTQDDLIIIHQENVGGAGGFYTGLKYAAEHSYDFAWVMDDDIEANPSTLKELCDGYDYLDERGEKPGFLCSKVVNPKGETVNLPAIDYAPNATGYPSWDKYLEKGLVKINIATFVSVFFSCEVIHQIGLPYKEFFIWGDDTEYTLRISHLYPCFVAGSSEIVHKRFGGIIDFNKMCDINRMLLYKNFIRNHLFLAKLGLKGPKGLYNEMKFNIKQIIKYALKGRFLKSKIYLKGIKEFISFNPQIDFPIKG